ncbi:MAG: GNAT family N-acetyltransferase [Acidobacteriia bacterium]|nr:GNAT family N-acetyltransferase [Terriglobia bacterium]
MKLRLMTLQDIPAGMRLKEIAGWNQMPADWERFLNASPDACFIAECEGRVVGTVTTISYEDRFSWIGMVLVDPDFRGRGIGTRLLEKAISHLDARGIPTLKLDATPQGKPIYEKLGFVSEYEIERWALRRAAGCAPTAEPAVEDLTTILALDHQVFGASRGDLLRSLANCAPQFVCVARHGTEILGYAFGRRGSLADHLGPWIAQDESAVGDLLETFLRRSHRDTVFVDCLQSNPWARSLLRAHGFGLSRPLTRMFRGPNAHPGRPSLVCAALGPEFG